MHKKVKANIINNDVWIKDHFEMIVDKYGGRYPYIFVAAGKIFPIKLGDDIAKIEKQITAKYGKPIGMPVPKREDIFSILFLKK